MQFVMHHCCRWNHMEQETMTWSLRVLSVKLKNIKMMKNYYLSMCVQITYDSLSCAMIHQVYYFTYKGSKNHENRKFRFLLCFMITEISKINFIFWHFRKRRRKEEWRDPLMSRSSKPTPLWRPSVMQRPSVTTTPPDS